ncbi:MAG: GntR family transcriptional regulator [Betaproteobacteria bacterium]|nr:GntR family transcriptional regulator [Betaproteobacteria bacterium]
MSQEKITPLKVSDAVAEALERRILEGVVRPGERLAPERDLAVNLGVSRASLREAIQKLASRGLVRSRQGGGTFVTDCLSAALTGPWQEMLAGHPDLRGDLLELRRVLLAQTAEWAAARRTEEELAELARLADSLDESFAGADRKAQAYCDAAFYRALADAAHNVFAAHLMATLSRLLESDLTLTLSELSAAPRAFLLLRGQYQALFAAVRDKNPVAARQAALVHGDFVRESLAEALRSASRRKAADFRFAVSPSLS